MFNKQLTRGVTVLFFLDKFRYLKASLFRCGINWLIALGREKALKMYEIQMTNHSTTPSRSLPCC